MDSYKKIMKLYERAMVGGAMVGGAMVGGEMVGGECEGDILIFDVFVE